MTVTLYTVKYNFNYHYPYIKISKIWKKQKVHNQRNAEHEAVSHACTLTDHGRCIGNDVNFTR